MSSTLSGHHGKSMLVVGMDIVLGTVPGHRYGVGITALEIMYKVPDSMLAIRYIVNIADNVMVVVGRNKLACCPHQGTISLALGVTVLCCHFR